MNEKDIVESTKDDDSRYPVPIDEGLRAILGDDFEKVEEARRQAQAGMIMGHTPEYAIKSRTGKGGTYEYVKHSWVGQQLNLIFGWRWSFEIVWQQFGKEWVIVRGRLTVPIGDTWISKEQYGRSEVKKLRSGGLMDPGNDIKAASSDALKKCASLLGIAADVYAKREEIELTFNPEAQEAAVEDYF